MNSNNPIIEGYSVFIFDFNVLDTKSIISNNDKKIYNFSLMQLNLLSITHLCKIENIKDNGEYMQIIIPKCPNSAVIFNSIEILRR